MKKKLNSPYKKLIGKLSIFDSSALYEGEKHLLLVDGLVYQRYIRFYYDKIQSVQIAKTKRYLLELAIGFGGAVAVAVMLEFLAAFAGFDTYDAPVLRGAQIMLAGPFVLFGLISEVQKTYRKESALADAEMFQGAFQAAARLSIAVEESSSEESAQDLKARVLAGSTWVKDASDEERNLFISKFSIF